MADDSGEKTEEPTGKKISDIQEIKIIRSSSINKQYGESTLKYKIDVARVLCS